LIAGHEMFGEFHGAKSIAFNNPHVSRYDRRRFEEESF
jgi:hypothetical protein